MKLIQLSLLFILLLAGTVMAQECGPNCPACSGAGSSGGALVPSRSLTVSGLSIPTADEETTVLNIHYGLLGWLDAGGGYAFRTEKFLWNVRTQPLVEQKSGFRPGIILGSGSVQTGGADQSLYMQFIKSIELNENVGWQVSAGAATLLPDFDESYGLGSVTASFYKRIAFFGSYDGKSFHEGVSWMPLDRLTVSALMVESEFPAVSCRFTM